MKYLCLIYISSKTLKINIKKEGKKYRENKFRSKYENHGVIVKM